MSSRRRFILFLIFPFLSVTKAFAHGEDRPGPHGGFIQMPGAFHTEVVLKSQNSIQVYLLDMNWKSPTVRESELELSLKGKSETHGTCQIRSDHYFCEFPKKVNLRKKGLLVLRAKREGQQGNEIEYSLPLKHEKTQHQEHH